MAKGAEDINRYQIQEILCAMLAGLFFINKEEAISLILYQTSANLKQYENQLTFQHWDTSCPYLLTIKSESALRELIEMSRENVW